MQPECIPTQLEFEDLGRRRVVGRFDGGRLTTDGGVLLLREVDRRFRVTERLAGSFRDHRSARRIEHRLETVVAQRVLGLAAGFEDLNDHDRLRTDSVLALASGCRDVTGERRRRAPRQKTRQTQQTQGQQRTGLRGQRGLGRTFSKRRFPKSGSGSDYRLWMLRAPAPAGHLPLRPAPGGRHAIGANSASPAIPSPPEPVYIGLFTASCRSGKAFGQRDSLISFECSKFRRTN